MDYATLMITLTFFHNSQKRSLQMEHFFITFNSQQQKELANH